MNIKQLRKKVLELAFSGELTKSDKSNWETVAFSDLPVEWKRGNGLRKSDVIPNGKYQCVLYGELFTKYKGHRIEGDISRTDNEGTVKSQSGDILVPGTSTAAKSEIIRAREISEDGIIIGGDINIIRPKKDLFASKWIPYLFDSEMFKDKLINDVSGSTGIIHLSNSAIKNLLIPLPPLAEQQRIVEKVDEIFAVLDSLSLSQAAIGRKRDLLMKKLLGLAITGKLTNEDTSGWKETTLGEVGTWKAGSTPLKSNLAYYRDGSVKWAIIADMKDMPINDTVTKISELALKDGSFRMNKVGNILVAMYGSIGKLAIVEEEMVTNQAILGCEPDSSVYNIFLFYFLMVSRDDLMRQGEGTSQMNISKGKIETFPINLPPLATQTRIVAKVDQLSTQLNKLETKL